jgi:hypothetical protein
MYVNSRTSRRDQEKIEASNRRRNKIIGSQPDVLKKRGALCQARRRTEDVVPENQQEPEAKEDSVVTMGA